MTCSWPPTTVAFCSTQIKADCRNWGKGNIRKGSGNYKLIKGSAQNKKSAFDLRIEILSMIIIRMPIMIIRREGLLECPDDGRRLVGSHTTTALTAPHRSASIQTLFLFRFLDSSYSSKLNLCVYKEILKGHLPKAVFQSILESELERWRVKLH